MLRRLLCLPLLVLLGAQATAEVSVIHAGTLLAVPGEPAQTEQTLVIRDGRVADILDGYVDASTVDAQARLIDLSQAFVMPGLMDMHVHLQSELGPGGDRQRLTFSDADYAMQSAHYARLTLHAGFTTVRDVGSRPEQMYALRDAIAKGWVDGPRVVAAAGVSVTGGHGDVDGMSPDLLTLYSRDRKTLCDGPFDCRRATRAAIKYGADLIKITSTGGVMSDTDTGTGQQMTDDELREVVETAHSLGRKVASHAHAAAGINAALRAGVDSIEHGSYADKESIRLFKKTGAYLVPTLIAGDTVVRIAKASDYMSDRVKAKALRVGADMMTHFAAAQAAGVKIAFGTDMGVGRHGDNAREAVLMHQAGMPAEDILVSATINGADLIDRSADLGTLEQGKIADVVAMRGNPLEDISVLTNIHFVMKDGRVAKHKLEQDAAAH